MRRLHGTWKSMAPGDKYAHYIAQKFDRPDAGPRIVLLINMAKIRKQPTQSPILNMRQRRFKHYRARLHQLSVADPVVRIRSADRVIKELCSACERSQFDQQIIDLEELELMYALHENHPQQAPKDSILCDHCHE